MTVKNTAYETEDLDRSGFAQSANKISLSGYVLSAADVRYNTIGEPSVWLEVESYHRRGQKIVPIYVRALLIQETSPYKIGDRVWLKGSLRVRKITTVEREPQHDDAVNAYVKVFDKMPTIRGGTNTRIDWQKLISAEFIKVSPPDDISREGQSSYWISSNDGWYEVSRIKRREAYDIIVLSHSLFDGETAEDNNKVQIEGILKTTPKLEYVPPRGEPRIKMKIAVKQPKPLSNPIDVFTAYYWGKSAEILSSGLKPGDNVAILGFLNVHVITVEEWFRNQNLKWYKAPIQRSIYEIGVRQLVKA